MNATKLREVLSGYEAFLRERHLAPERRVPHLVRWVREFLHSAGEHAGYSFEQTLDPFLGEVGEWAGTGPEFRPEFHPDLPQLLSAADIS